MTCIAWDGKTLAADKRCCYGTMVNTVTKIWRLKDREGRVFLFGGAGDFGGVEAMREWVLAGCDPASYPDIQGTDQWVAVIVVDGSGARLYEKTPYAIRYDAPCITLGSGREFARAALHLGKTAREAVEVACALDSGCGNGIDVLTLDASPDAA